ncbi:MAG: sensor histidine kinase [Aggregatilineales bacterium]
MAYNLYVITTDMMVCLLCGAVAILLFFQLQQDPKTQAFMALVLLECFAEGDLAIARVFAMLHANFRISVYLGTTAYAMYPAVQLAFVAEFFELWTPFKRGLVRVLRVVPLLVLLAAALGILYSQLTLDSDGSIRYSLTAWSVVLLGFAEGCVLYILFVTLRHALKVGSQEERRVVFGFVVLLVTSLMLPITTLFRLFGALGEFVSVLLMIGPVLRMRLFNPLQQLNQEVQQANAAKTKIISHVSHELRNTIGDIITLSEGMLSEPVEYDNQPLPEVYRRDMQLLMRTSRQAAQHLGDIMDWAKIDTGMMEISPQTVDPVPILQEAVHYAQGKAYEGVQVRAAFAPTLPRLRADDLRLKQIMTNLVSNAAKFTAQGWITIGADMDGRFLRFSVADTGRGITLEEQARLFKMYSQASVQVRREYGGHGLGLNICEDLVHLHGGHIWLESEPGNGTNFYFTIPLADSILTPPGEH